MSERLKILFLCTGNSCRSQMAEGWARHLRSDDMEAVSAGTETHGLNPNAVKVMAEAGVDISGARSKNVREFLDMEFDYVITVCKNASETCPFFPGAAKIVHAGFDDPPALAEAVEGDEEKLEIYYRVRDEIREFVEGLPGNLGERILTMQKDNDQIRDKVRKRYAETADSCGCGGTSCCTPSGPEALAVSERLGYSREELEALPGDSNMGLGCGNPVAIASLKEGETVLDLGSGGGIDCFLASKRVGDTGRVIGVDMTPEMILKARQGAAEGGFANVEFRLGEIEHLPVANGTVDVIISNCVINLSPDKPQVLRETYRILKSGGRLAISDVVTVRDLPENVKNDLDAYAGCVAGSVSVSLYEEMLKGAGFSEVKIVINEASREFINGWFPGMGVEDYVRSAIIEAIK